MGKETKELECLRKELKALQEKIDGMEKWVAWRDERLQETFKQIGVEWHPALLLPAVGYRRFAHEMQLARATA